jgi:hypothetical protein
VGYDVRLRVRFNGNEAYRLAVAHRFQVYFVAVIVDAVNHATRTSFYTKSWHIIGYSNYV